MSLSGKVALVTGGSQNIERARGLAKEGATLALHDESLFTKGSMLDMRNELGVHVRVSIHSGNLSDAAAVQALFTEVLSAHKRIDLVVNTAGMVLQKPATAVSGREYDNVFAYAVFVDEQRRRWTKKYFESIQHRV